jgi:hypothetical protein
MRGPFRDTPKIIFCMGSVKTIDEFIARSFVIFHCATSVLRRFPDAKSAMIRALRAGRLLRCCGSFAATTIPTARTIPKRPVRTDSATPRPRLLL